MILLGSDLTTASDALSDSAFISFICRALAPKRISLSKSHLLRGVDQYLSRLVFVINGDIWWHDWIIDVFISLLLNALLWSAQLKNCWNFHHCLSVDCRLSIVECRCVDRSIQPAKIDYRIPDTGQRRNRLQQVLTEEEQQASWSTKYDGSSSISCLAWSGTA